MTYLCVIYGFSFIFHWSIFLSFHQYHIDFCNYKINLDTNRLILSILLFFKVILAIPVALPSYLYFRITSISRRNFLEYLIEIVLMSISIWLNCHLYYVESSNPWTHESFIRLKKINQHCIVFRMWILYIFDRFMSNYLFL